MFGSDRTALRRTFAEAWRKDRQGLLLEPLQALIVEVIGAHPEYHRTVEDERSLERDYLPDGGQSNPFLHMAMHLSLAEQCAADRPPGITKALGRAVAREQRRGASVHDVQHQAMRCLERVLWEAQSEGRAPDEAGYLKCVRSLAQGKGVGKGRSKDVGSR